MRRSTPPTVPGNAPPTVLRAPLRSTLYVITVGLLAAVLLYALQGVVARNQRIQVRLADMQGAINLLNAREWEARTGYISPEHRRDVPTRLLQLSDILSQLRERTGNGTPLKNV